MASTACNPNDEATIEEKAEFLSLLQSTPPANHKDEKKKIHSSIGNDGKPSSSYPSCRDAPACHPEEKVHSSHSSFEFLSSLGNMSEQQRNVRSQRLSEIRQHKHQRETAVLLSKIQKNTANKIIKEQQLSADTTSSSLSSVAFAHSTAIAVNAPTLQSSPIIIDILETRKGTMQEIVDRRHANVNEMKKNCNGGDTISSGSSSAVEASGENRQLFIMLTGNPGIVAFYRDFASHLTTQAHRFIGMGNRQQEPFTAEGGGGREKSHQQDENNNDDDDDEDQKCIDGTSTINNSNNRLRNKVQLDVIVIGYAGHSAVEEAYVSNNGGSKLHGDKTVEIISLPSRESHSSASPHVPKRKKVFDVPDQTAVLDAIIHSLFVNTDEKEVSNNPPSSSSYPSSSLRYNKLGYKHIYIGGHSCGTYTGLPVVAKHSSSSQSSSSASFLFTRFFMIAPTISNLAQSPKAIESSYWMFNTIVMWCAWALLSTLFVFIFRTAASRLTLVKWLKPSLQLHLQVALSASITPMIVYNALALGKSEMNEIGKLDAKKENIAKLFISHPADNKNDSSTLPSSTADLLRSVRHRLVIWWPQRDHWAPLAFREEIMKKALGIDEKEMGKMKCADSDTVGGTSGAVNDIRSLADRDLLNNGASLGTKSTTVCDGDDDGGGSSYIITGGNPLIPASQLPANMLANTRRSGTPRCKNNQNTPPICNVVEDPKFPHAWSTHYSFAAATEMVLPFMEL